MPGRSGIWILGAAAAAAAWTAHAETIVFDRPDEVFRAEEMRLTSGDSRVNAKDVELEGTLGMSVGGDGNGASGTLSLETGSLTAAAIHSRIDGTRGASASYNAVIRAATRLLKPSKFTPAVFSSRRKASASTRASWTARPSAMRRFTLRLKLRA